MDQIALHGAYYPNNFGDVLILDIQTNWIKELTNKDVVLPYASEIYRKKLNVSKECGDSSLIDSEKLIFGAGGYLGEPGSHKWRWGFNFLKNHSLPYKIAKKNNVNFAIIGTGAGEVTNLFTRRDIINICNDAQMIVVRDEESKDSLVNYGIRPSSIKVTADVALSITYNDIPKKSTSKIDNLFQEKDKLKYGLHVGVDRNSRIFGEQVEILFKESIDFFNTNRNITPVIIIDNDNKAQNDAADFLQKELINKPIIYKHYDIWETVALLSELNVVLTNKLHIGIVSYALGNLPLSFPYHPKTKRFYRQIEQENLCIPLTELKEKDVETLLYSTLDYNWLSSINEKQNKLRKKLRRKAFENKFYMESFLNN